MALVELESDILLNLYISTYPRYTEMYFADLNMFYILSQKRFVINQNDLKIETK